jgi:gas vesicle protein
MKLDIRPDGDPQRIALTAFACGVLIGAAFGVLFAPAGGRETRHWMAERSRIAREHLRERNRRASEVLHREGVRGLLRWQEQERIAETGENTVAPVSPVLV